MSRRFLLTFFGGVICVAAIIRTRPANSFASFSAESGAAKSSASVFAQTSATLSPVQGPADLVLTNALIETMDAAHDWAGAIAVRGESIVAVSHIDPGSAGSRDASTADAAAIKPWLGSDTRIINLHGAFVMPGFNDAHAHIGKSALAKLAIDFTGVQSLAEFQQRIRIAIKSRAPGD